MSSTDEILRSALARHQAGDLAAAEATYRQVLAREPDNPQALHLLGVIFHQRGDHHMAVGLIERVVKVAPQAATVRVNFANALAGSGELDKAIDEYRTALRLDPRLLPAAQSLAHALMRAGRLPESAEAFAYAISLTPNAAALHNDLGFVLLTLGKRDEAEKEFVEAARLDPSRAEAPSNLANLYRLAARTSAAVDAGEAAVRLNPQFAAGWSNLANALSDQAQNVEADRAYRRAMELAPQVSILTSNWLFHLDYCDWIEPAKIAREHLAWGGRFDSLAATRHPNDPNPARKLKIGYVSGDFREHPVAYFLEPLLRAHDRERFELFCYADQRANDGMTQRLMSHANHWRSIAGQSDDRVARQVREDNIDLLVDLAGHSEANRLMVFARKPAPVQITYLGYPNTTGLGAIDYRIVDALTDPPGDADAWHAERLVRLNRCFLCYGMRRELPDVMPPPAQANGLVTFGSFNNIAKVSPTTIWLWVQVLRAVPGSRLILKYRSLADLRTREIVKQSLQREGLDTERVELLGHASSHAEHLRLYSRVDIALDTTPYNGTTTTCEALSMGVPVVTLSGSAHVSRVGNSLLTAAGFGEWIAETEPRYVEIASRMAGDLDHLGAIRRELRPKLQASSLCDEPAFAREMEKAMRNVWTKWCERAGG